ncbi:MAG: hypothetical protein WAS36_01265 [Candidatus Saccharimonadales bacterium]
MRNYLVEDLAQLQRYFPNAKPIAIETPFDITEKPFLIAQANEEDSSYAMPDWSAQWIM